MLDFSWTLGHRWGGGVAHFSVTRSDRGTHTHRRGPHAPLSAACITPREHNECCAATRQPCNPANLQRHIHSLGQLGRYNTGVHDNGSVPAPTKRSAFVGEGNHLPASVPLADQVEFDPCRPGRVIPFHATPLRRALAPSHGQRMLSTVWLTGRKACEPSIRRFGCVNANVRYGGLFASCGTSRRGRGSRCTSPRGLFLVFALSSSFFSSVLPRLELRDVDAFFAGTCPAFDDHDQRAAAVEPARQLLGVLSDAVAIVAAGRTITPVLGESERCPALRDRRSA